MHCPKCEAKPCVMYHVVGILKIGLCHCHVCQHHWWNVECPSFDPEEYERELERLLLKYSGSSPDYVRCAIHHLERKLDAYKREGLTEEVAKCRMRNDLWERLYLGSLLKNEVF